MAVEGAVRALSDGNVSESSIATMQQLKKNKKHKQQQLPNAFTSGEYFPVSGQNQKIISTRCQVFQQHLVPNSSADTEGGHQLMKTTEFAEIRPTKLH